MSLIVMNTCEPKGERKRNVSAPVKRFDSLSRRVFPLVLSLSVLILVIWSWSLSLLLQQTHKKRRRGKNVGKNHPRRKRVRKYILNLFSPPGSSLFSGNHFLLLSVTTCDLFSRKKEEWRERINWNDWTKRKTGQFFKWTVLPFHTFHSLSPSQQLIRCYCDTSGRKVETKYRIYESKKWRKSVSCWYLYYVSGEEEERGCWLTAWIKGEGRGTMGFLSAAKAAASAVSASSERPSKRRINAQESQEDVTKH